MSIETKRKTNSEIMAAARGKPYAGTTIKA